MPKNMTSEERRAVMAHLIWNRGGDKNNVTVYSNSSHNTALMHSNIRDPPPLENEHQAEVYHALEKQ